MIPLGLALALQAASVDDASPPLMEAEAALRAGIHDKCVELARDAVKSGRLEAQALAQAWLVRGRCHVLAGDTDKAERAYAVAVRITPGIVLPTDDAVFARVRPEGRAEATALRLVVNAVVLGDGAAPGTIVGVDVLVQDDLGLADRFELIDGDDREVAGAPVTGPVAPLARVHRLSGFPVAGLRARLLDKAGNRLRTVDVAVGDDVRRALEVAGAEAPPTTTTAAAPGTLAYVGAGLLAAGFATATVTGISTAVAMQADETRVIDDELPLLLGFGAGVLAFVGGGALIAFDRIDDGPTTATTTTTTTTTTATTAPAPTATTAPATTTPASGGTTTTPTTGATP